MIGLSKMLFFKFSVSFIKKHIYLFLAGNKRIKPGKKKKKKSSLETTCLNKLRHRKGE